MSQVKNELVQVLPYLRRYARLLTGHSRLGDVLTMMTMQEMTAKPSDNSLRRSSRLRAYQIMTRLWRDPAIAHLGQSIDDWIDSETLERKPCSMAPVSRAAFLLVWVEGFTHHTAAEILGVADDEFEALLREAHISLSQQLATDVLIIEDELLIAFELESILTALGHNVTSVVRTHRLAVKQAKRFPPKLILADINLADGSSGIEAVQEIMSSVRVPVIFITAYPERLLTGQLPEPTFVLTKPFKAEEIRAVIGQSLFFNLTAASGGLTEEMVNDAVSGRMAEALPYYG